MSLGLGLGLTAAAVVGVLTPTAGWAATTSALAMSNVAATSSATATSSALATSTTPASANAPAAGDPDTTVTFTVTNGALAMTAPTGTNLGASPPGGTITGLLGDVTVTDNRALLAATWTAIASSTDFITGGASLNETIPSENVTYTPGTFVTTGKITTTGRVITLTQASQTTVSATAGVGNNSAVWDPTLVVTLPAAAVAGAYTGTLTQSAA